MYQALLYLKTNQPVCLFTHLKGIKIGPSRQELRGVSKFPRTLKHPVVRAQTNRGRVVSDGCPEVLRVVLLLDVRVDEVEHRPQGVIRRWVAG